MAVQVSRALITAVVGAVSPAHLCGVDLGQAHL